MSDVPYKVRINRMNIVRALLLLSMPKKVKEALRTRLNGNKRTESFVRLKKVAKWKTNLNLGTSACYENLPIKTHLTKACNFFPCKRNPPSPKSVASRVHTAFPQITQKILITIIPGCNSITVIPGFWKYSLLKKQSIRTIIFSQSPRFQFSSPILYGLSAFFNAHHFFMRKQFTCVDCYTDRLAFSNIILHKTAIRWILVASQAGMRKDECVPKVVAYEWNLIVISYWREIL